MSTAAGSGEHRATVENITVTKECEWIEWRCGSMQRANQFIRIWIPSSKSHALTKPSFELTRPPARKPCIKGNWSNRRCISSGSVIPASSHALSSLGRIGNKWAKIAKLLINWLQNGPNPKRERPFGRLNRILSLFLQKLRKFSHFSQNFKLVFLRFLRFLRFCASLASYSAF